MYHDRFSIKTNQQQHHSLHIPSYQTPWCFTDRKITVTTNSECFSRCCELVTFSNKPLPALCGLDECFTAMAATFRLLRMGL